MVRLLPALTLGVCTAFCAPASSQDNAKPTTWKNLDTLKTIAAAEAAWHAQGKKSRVDVTAKGLVLPGNSRMMSGFQLADGASIRFTYTANNRNAFVKLCGKEIEVKSPGRKGSEWYVLEIVRKGRSLNWGVMIVDAKMRVVGKTAKQNAVLIGADEVDKPARIVFGSHVVPLSPPNSVKDVTFKSIVVNGPVVPPPDGK